MRRYTRFIVNFLLVSSNFLIFFVRGQAPALQEPAAQASNTEALLEQMYEPAIYAPWRDIYKARSKKTTSACVFCDYAEKRLVDFPVLACYEHCFVVLNIYPYTKGHVLVIPYQHGSSLSDLPAEARAEIMHVVAFSVDAIQGVLGCPGFNIGVNMGSVAKASIPDHLHFHVMPRYEVDAGFATVIGGVRVVAWDLLELYQAILAQYQHNIEYE